MGKREQIDFFPRDNYDTDPSPTWGFANNALLEIARKHFTKPSVERRDEILKARYITVKQKEIEG